MPFGLTIGTERATALQNAIQDELIKRGYSPDADPVMAEYITIMIINNKTAPQISSELEDLIGSDFDRSFTDWLFVEAAKGAPEELIGGDSQATTDLPAAQPSEPPAREPPPHLPQEPARRNPPSGPRVGAQIYQQAKNQAIASTSPSGQKRSASARSPSPGGHPPNKTRRTDVPVGPRAMRDGGAGSGAHGANPRSLADRIGGAAPGNMHHQPHHRNNSNAGGFSRNDDIQARIDNITSGSPMDAAAMQAAMQGGFMPPGMDMNAMAMGANPLMLQEMMMNQMALMAQMANSLGMMTGGGFGPQGFPGMQQDMGMYGQQGMNGFQQGGPGQQQQHHNGGNGNRGRGTGRGGRGSGRGRGGASGGDDHAAFQQQAAETPKPAPLLELRPNAAIPIVAPAPTVPEAQPPKPAFAVPERPQSPTLCKFGMKCTNALCRWAHPSPVATDQSGVVLSNEACEAGRNCVDKDCVKGHVSPAAVNPALAVEHASKAAPPTPTASSPVACRYGAACTRQTTGCPYQHPAKPNHFAQQCRFGAGCTRATCPFQHPEGRVLPGTFHRGLSTTGPMVSVSTPPTGSIGGASHHRSVTFNNANGGSGSRASTEAPGKEELEKRMKELEEKKSEAQRLVKEAEEKAAADKKPSVAITA